MEENSSSPSPSPSPSPSDVLDDRECRVCRTEEEPGRPLYAPCKCSGSILWAHADCLMQWLDHSRKTKCELCGYKFVFSPLYASDAPEILSLWELIQSIINLYRRKWFPLTLRVYIISTLWLFIVPYTTNILYRLWFLRSASWVNIGFIKRITIRDIWNDTLAGIVISVLIIFSFLAFISFAEFLRFHMDNRHENNVPEDGNVGNINHNQNQNQLEGNNGNQQANNVPAGQPVNGGGVMPNAGNQPREVVQEQDQQNEPNQQRERDAEEVDAESDSTDEDEQQQDRWREPENENFVLNDARLQNNNAGLRRRIRAPERPPVNNNNQNVRQPNAAGLPPVPPRPVPAQGRMRPRPAANNRRPFNDDFEQIELNIAIDELIGLRGPLLSSVRNVAWLLSFNAAYLGLFGFIPFTIGLSFLSMFSQHTLFMVPYVSLISEIVLSRLPPQVPRAYNLLNEMMEESKRRGDCLQLNDLGILLTGYAALGISALFWKFSTKALSPLVRQPIFRSLIWVLECLNAVIKVSCLLLLKMIVIPIILGFGADLALSGLFTDPSTDILYSRMVFSINYPIGSVLIHWVFGISFMLFATVSVLQLREVLHRDILASIIRQHENHPDLLRTIVDESCIRHAHRMLLSLMIYSLMLFLLFYLPVRILTVFAASPILNLEAAYLLPELQIPFELLLSHMVVLSLLEKCKDEIGKMEYYWLKYICEKLGLIEFILPRMSFFSQHTYKTKTYILRPPPLHFNPHARHMQPQNLRDFARRHEPWPEDADAVLPYRLLPRSRPSYLYFRVLALFILAWFTLVVFIFGCLLVPLLVGRLSFTTFLNAFGVARHDPVSFAVGAFMVSRLLFILRCMRGLSRLPSDERKQLSSSYLMEKYMITNAWFLCIPFMLGIVCEIFFLPAENHSIARSYFVGLFLLFSWSRLVTRRTSRLARRLLRHRQTRQLNREEQNLNEEQHRAASRYDCQDIVQVTNDEITRRLRRDGRDAQTALHQLGRGADISSQLKISAIQLEYIFKHRVPMHLNVFQVRNCCSQLIFPLWMNIFIPCTAAIVFSKIVVFLYTGEYRITESCFLGYSSHSDPIQKALLQWVMGCTIVLFVLFRTYKDIFYYGKQFHDYVRNDRYLIGKQLHNMER